MPRLLLDEPLAPRTSFRLGGPATRLIEAESEHEIIDALRGVDSCFVLGGGSNLLVSDEGFRGLVVAIQSRGVAIQRDGDDALVTAAAGEPWDALVARCVAEGFSGVECLSGIPGQVGATPIQNVGAYGQEVSDTIASVRAYDRHLDSVIDLAPAACEFAYRDSAFKSRWPGRFVVLSVTFRLRPGAPARPRYAELENALGDRPLTLSLLRDTVIELRRRKGMVLDERDPDTRSAGSFFTNPIVADDRWPDLQARVAARLGPDARIPSFAAGPGARKLAAAWLIEQAGFKKGHALGSAAISSKHALALTSRGSSAADVLALARQIQRGVAEAFGVELTPEPILLGF